MRFGQPTDVGRLRRLFRRRWHEESRPEPAVYRPDVVTVSAEVDFIALAHMLIDQHQAAARAQAARFIEEARQDNDADAVADWTAVEQAIVLLTDDSATTMN